MPGFVYILKCADGSFYVGSTCDVEQRSHSINAAALRERQLERSTAAKKLALIEGRLSNLEGVSRRARAK